MIRLSAPGCAPAAVHHNNSTGSLRVVSVNNNAKTIAPLVDPAKLRTLKADRAANPRVQKYVYWLATAQTKGADPKTVASEAVALAGMKGDAAKLTVDAMLRNLDRATKLGCLDTDGLLAMRQGKAPTVRSGPYAGDKLSVDHIIPRAIVPELDKVIANLELMPLRMNEGKSAQIGSRQIDLARKFHSAGLLSAKGFSAVDRAANR